MPSQARTRQAKIQTLQEEQECDARYGHVFPEKITPQKPPLPCGLTEAEYFHLILSMSALTVKQVAKHSGKSLSCVSLHRWNAYRKLGPEMNRHWKKISQLFKTHNIFLLPAGGSPLPDSESGEEDSLE